MTKIEPTRKERKAIFAKDVVYYNTQKKANDVTITTTVFAGGIAMRCTISRENWLGSTEFYEI